MLVALGVRRSVLSSATGDDSVCFSPFFRCTLVLSLVLCLSPPAGTSFLNENPQHMCCVAEGRTTMIEECIADSADLASQLQLSTSHSSPSFHSLHHQTGRTDSEAGTRRCGSAREATGGGAPRQHRGARMGSARDWTGRERGKREQCVSERDMGAGARGSRTERETARMRERERNRERERSRHGERREREAACLYA